MLFSYVRVTYTAHVADAFVLCFKDSTGGHITGATLIGPLSGDNLSELDGCDYCNIAIYGEGSEDAADLLQESDFGGRLYFGPSVEDYTDAGFELSSAESIEPRCTTDTVIQDACEARWIDDGGDDSGESSGTESPSDPSAPTEPEPSPPKEPTKENNPGENTATPPTVPTSGVHFISVVLSCVIGIWTVFLF